MTEAIKIIPQWELDFRGRVDTRVQRTLDSGLALPADVEKVNALANLTKLAINLKSPIALTFGRQLIELSDEIIESGTDIERKIEELGI